MRFLSSKGQKNVIKVYKFHKNPVVQFYIDLLHQHSLEQGFLYVKDFPNVTVLTANYDKNIVYHTIDNMVQNSDEKTINAYFFNLDGDGKELSIKRTLKRANSDDEKMYVLHPAELKEIMSRNKGVNFIYCNSCFSENLFLDGLPDRSVYVHSSKSNRLSFGDGRDMTAFMIAYRVASNVFKEPVDFSDFNLKVPAEKMDVTDTKDKMLWENAYIRYVGTELGVPMLGIMYCSRREDEVDFSSIPLNKWQLKTIKKMSDKLGTPVDKSQTHQNIGIKYNVQLIF